MECNSSQQDVSWNIHYNTQLENASVIICVASNAIIVDKIDRHVGNIDKLDNKELGHRTTPRPGVVLYDKPANQLSSIACKKYSATKYKHKKHR